MQYAYPFWSNKLRKTIKTAFVITKFRTKAKILKKCCSILGQKSFPQLSLKTM